MADPERGDDRRQTTLDADRKMYDYKLTHKHAGAQASGRKDSYVLDDLDNRVFEALSMASEGCYPLVFNVDSRESHWSPLAVRDFGLPREHVHDPIPVWLEVIHPDDREHVRNGIERMINGLQHNHCIQYRAKDVTGKYVLCESRGYRLEGSEGMPTMYVGYIINRSAAEVTDPATGPGNYRGLVAALGETRTRGCSVGLVAVKVNRIAEVNRNMDDFGTGHSSLGMLGTMDIDALKLDREFIKGDVQNDMRRVKVVRSILAMADALNVPVVVEGVETPEQVELLRKFGAQFIQGFYFYRSMAYGELDALLDAGK